MPEHSCTPSPTPGEEVGTTGVVARIGGDTDGMSKVVLGAAVAPIDVKGWLDGTTGVVVVPAVGNVVDIATVVEIGPKA
jgi:hypothetical protein